MHDILSKICRNRPGIGNIVEAMKKEKILFVLPWLPYPLVSGGHQALFNGIVAIKDDFDIFIAYEATDDEDYREAFKSFSDRIPSAKLLPLLHKKTPTPSFRERFAHKLNSVILKLFRIKKDNSWVRRDDVCYTCDSWIYTVSPQNREWTEHISGLCLKYHFDMIQVEMPWMVSQVLSLPETSKNIFVHHEVGFVKREQEIMNMDYSDYVRACKSFADYNEVNLLNKYDAVVSLSVTDAEKMKFNGVNVPIYSSFAVVDASAYLKVHTSDGKRLTFLGSDSHNPNLIGITWFLENCWHKLKEVDPVYRLDIIGNWSTTRIEEIKKKYNDVEFLGYVDDLGEALKQSVMIVPITIGSGIRMKILEASSRGIPFVSTTIGADGIPVVSGQHCFIADSQEGFVDSILKLRDEDLQKSLILNANGLVKELYSMEALRENRMAIYKKVSQMHGESA